MLPDHLHNKTWSEVINGYILAGSEDDTIFNHLSGKVNLSLTLAHVETWPNKYWAYDHTVEVRLVAYNRHHGTITVQPLDSPKVEGIVADGELTLHIDWRQSGPDIYINRVDGVSFKDHVPIEPDAWWATEEEL